MRPGPGDPAPPLHDPFTPAVGSRGLSRWSTPSLVSFLILLAVLPYLNTLFNAFVYDDHTQVMNNPYVQSFRHLKDIFTTTVWSYVGVQRVTNYYRPMMTFGYLLCYQAFGPLAYGFHLASVILHAAIVCLLFRVADRVFENRSLGLVAAGVFALHPIHTESVAWIAAVTDLELTLFYLLTFYFFLRVARPGGARSDLAQVGMTGSYVLAIFSKEPALTLPLVATVYEHFYRDDRAETTPREKFRRYGVLWLLAVAYLLFRIRFFGAFAPVLQRTEVTGYEALLSGMALFGKYLWKLLWPVDLLAFHMFRKSASLLDPGVIVGLAALVICATLFIVLWRRDRRVSFGIVWMLATLAPVLNVRWMAANAFAERYLYLPSVGFAWVVAWGLEKLWDRTSERGLLARRALATAVGILAALCAIRIVTRNRDWRTDMTLYTRTLAASPDSIHIRNNLAITYWNQGNVEAAGREWRAALKLAPNDIILLNNLGLLYARQKRYPEAVENFRRAIQRKPNYTDAHFNLGTAYLEMGKPELAESQFRTAVALSPLNSRAHNALGKLYFEAGRLREAEEHFRKSVESRPNAEGYNGLGDLYLRAGAPGRAESVFKRALSDEPYNSHAHFNLGAIYAATGRIAEAVREYQAGLESHPSNREALAALQKLKGQVSDAKP